jgi:dTDP-4-dehydrorhamnose reductase
MNARNHKPRLAIITGGGGQLATELIAEAPSSWTATALSRNQLDITSASGVATYISGTNPDLVINAAGYTRVDQAEREPELAFAANAGGVANLAKACGEIGCRLIHVSTDYVFDGKSEQPYRPTDPPSPINTYGESKLAGERNVLEMLPDNGVIFRTAWLYSTTPPNFVRTMLKLLPDRDRIGVVSDQFGSPTWANGLAKILWRAADERELSGIFHWADGGAASWFDLARAVEEEAIALGITRHSSPVIHPIASAEYPTAAKRPAYTVLDSQGTSSRLNVTQLPWRRQLRAMLQATLV